MAIKVGGTTVVDDSRQLSNIASVDATTVAALGAAGVGGGGGSFDATADGNITAGDAVYLKSTGNVDAISNSYTAASSGSGLTLTSSSNNFVKSGQSFWYNDSTVGFVWQDSSAYAWIKIYSVSGTTLSSGNAIGISNTYTGGAEGVVSGVNGQGADADYVVAALRNASGNNTLALISRSGTTPTVQTTNSNLTFNNASATRVIYCPNDNCWLAVFKDSTAGRVFKITRSGNSMTVSNYATVNNGAWGSEACAFVYDPDIGRAVHIVNNGFSVYAAVIDASGTTPSVYTYQQVFNISNEIGYTSSAEEYDAHYDTVNDRIIMVGSNGGTNPPFYAFFKAATNGTFTFNKIGYIGQAAGKTISDATYDTKVWGNTYDNTSQALVLRMQPFATTSVKTAVMYLKADGLSFTDPVFGDGVLSDGTEDIDNPYEKTYKGIQFSSSGKVALLYKGQNSDDSKAMIFQPTLTKALSYIGLAAENISSSSTGEIQVVGGVNENQTGLSIGSDYYVQASGALGTTDAGFGLVGKAVASDKIVIKG